MMFVIALASAADFTSTDTYKTLTEACGKEYTVTFDAVAFKAAEVPIEKAHQKSKDIFQALGHLCGEDESQKADLVKITEITVGYHAASKPALSLEGTSVKVLISGRASSVYGAAYPFFEHLPLPRAEGEAAAATTTPDGALSLDNLNSDQREAYKQIKDKFDKYVVYAQESCHLEKPPVVKVDWVSFEPDFATRTYSYSDILNYCKLGMTLASACEAGTNPAEGVRSPGDKVHTWICKYDAGADEPVVSFGDGVITVGYNLETANMHETNDFLRKTFPK